MSTSVLSQGAISLQAFISHMGSIWNREKYLKYYIKMECFDRSWWIFPQL